MKSSAAGGNPRPPSPSGGSFRMTSRPPPPPPEPSGWLAGFGGLVSGAGRLLSSVLRHDSTNSGSGSAATGWSGSDVGSLSDSSTPTDYGTDRCNSLIFPTTNNQLTQNEKETVQKDYAEPSLAIVSDIEPKDAIMQLLMQETYSRSEFSTLVKIIQDRVVDSDSGGARDDEHALPVHGFDNRAAALMPVNQGFLNHNADKIQSGFKRSYSAVRDIPEDLRRVNPTTDGNSNISRFKQVDVVRNRLNKDLNSGFPLKLENLNVLTPFEQKMMDLSHQEHEHAARDESGSVSKLIFTNDIGAAPSVPASTEQPNGSTNRRRKSSWRATATTKWSPPKTKTGSSGRSKPAPASKIEPPAGNTAAPASKMESPVKITRRRKKSEIEPAAASTPAPASAIELPARSTRRRKNEIDPPAGSTADPASKIESTARNTRRRKNNEIEPPAGSTAAPALKMESTTRNTRRRKNNEVELPAGITPAPASEVESPAPGSKMESPAPPALASIIESPAGSTPAPPALASKMESPAGSTPSPAPATQIESPAGSTPAPTSKIELPRRITRQRKNNVAIKSEMELLVESTPAPVLAKDDPDYLPETRRSTRPRKVRGT